MKIENLINKHTDQLDWNNASIRIDVMQIDEQLFAYLSYFWDWVWISIKQSLCENFMRKWKQYILWNLICEYQFLSEPFIEEYQKYINWVWLSKYQNLSKSFLKKYKNHINWVEVSRNQNLPESFMEEIIEEFKGNLNYFPISKNYTLYFVLSYNLKKKHNLIGIGLNKYEI